MLLYQLVGCRVEEKVNADLKKFFFFFLDAGNFSDSLRKKTPETYELPS